MNVYSALARYYDALTEDVPYEKWANRAEALFDKFGRQPSILLDLACGTGSLTKIFADRGYDVIAVDSSAEMLSAASEKILACEKRPLLLNQSMEALDLYGTVDGVICGLDSINYLASPEILKAAFSRISLFLGRGGLFIFDINTEKKLRGLDMQVYTREAPGVFCVWQAQWSPKERLCRFYIDLFERKEDLYRRFSEVHTERAYSICELSSVLSNCSMEIKAVYSELSDRDGSEDDDRVLIVAEKL